ncbi:MAG: hypothetical protein Q8O74_03215, partial [bacterium]|nr:hypothetical protein [bacterium]
PALKVKSNLGASGKIQYWVGFYPHFPGRSISWLVSLLLFLPPLAASRQRRWRFRFQTAAWILIISFYARLVYNAQN